MPSDYQPYRKATLLIPSGPSNHLFVILTDENPDGEHLLVSITSIPDIGHYDATCLLSAGDHPFIKHDSYVLYRKCEVQRASRISRLVDRKFYIPRDDMSEEVTNKILEGVIESDFTPNFCKSFLS